MANNILKLLHFTRQGKIHHVVQQQQWVAGAGVGASSWLARPPLYTLQAPAHRCYSEGPPPQRSRSFFGKIMENLKEESERDTKMRHSIEEFKKDMDKLGKTETVIKARDKFHKIEEETAEGSRKARQHLKKLKERVAQTVEEAQRNEMMQRASRMTEGARETVQKVSANLSQKSEHLASSQAFKTMSETARAVKKEIDLSTLAGAGTRVYQAPLALRLRMERDPDAEQKIMEANTLATGVVLHKDSRFSQSWQNFRDNNPYVNRVIEWKTKLNESDNVIVRASVIVKDKMTDMFGMVFERTELSETLTEICKMDPSFDKDRFLLEVEYDIIPNVLEAMVRPDLEIFQDWAYERAYSIVAAETKQYQLLGHTKVTKVLDIDNVDLVIGKVLDEGPVLGITFQAQMVEYVTNSATGELVSGDPDQVLRRHYVWVFCRDQTQLDPRAAWRLLEYTYHSAAQLV